MCLRLPFISYWSSTLLLGAGFAKFNACYRYNIGKIAIEPDHVSQLKSDYLENFGKSTSVLCLIRCDVVVGSMKFSLKSQLSKIFLSWCLEAPPCRSMDLARQKGVVRWCEFDSLAPRDKSLTNLLCPDCQGRRHACGWYAFPAWRTDNSGSMFGLRAY